jgi:DNA repair exonuclease SbcCD ATPase subunit
LTPGSRRVLFLDESFAQLSEEYEPRLAEFLRELVDKTDLQIIMVTHSHAFSDIADQVYRFDLNDAGTTVVR